MMLISETGFLERMTEHAEGKRKKTRLEVAAEILERIDQLEFTMQGIPGGKWGDVLGKGADDLIAKAWAYSVLKGMVHRTITVGDPRLADSLQQLEDTIQSVPSTQAKQNFEELAMVKHEPPVEEFMEARENIRGITRKAIEAGLTTPGQALSEGQARGWTNQVS